MTPVSEGLARPAGFSPSVPGRSPVRPSAVGLGGRSHFTYAATEARRAAAAVGPATRGHGDAGGDSGPQEAPRPESQLAQCAAGCGLTLREGQRSRDLTTVGEGQQEGLPSWPARRPTHLISDHTRATMVARLHAQGHSTRPRLPVAGQQGPLGSVVFLICRKGFWGWQSR